jgi:hypothetical protein
VQTINQVFAAAVVVFKDFFVQFSNLNKPKTINLIILPSGNSPIM